MGGTSDVFKILSSSTRTSIFPVGILGFLLERSLGLPFTAMTNSDRKPWAFS